ncbi:reprolysin-like metallopeptidase [Pseudoduganella danionis]|uniref:reprolysin-like metallopeptidase n=1 Tax=Pseudoduganella danionis TaxID=1890295 RepID=UPI00361B91F0
MVYTPAVLAKEGSVAAVTAKIRAMVKSANAAYARSDADVLVNLVDIRAVNYKESGNGDIDLNRLLLKADGYLDEVLLWREETGADVVGMLGQGAAAWRGCLCHRIARSEISGSGFLMSQLAVT